MSDFDHFIEPTRVVLEQRKVASRLELTHEASFHVRPDIFGDRLVASLEAFVLTEKLVGDTKRVSGFVDFPSSPWQHFKQRHAASWWLGWLVARRPVQHAQHDWARDVTFERYATYPESTLRTRELGRPVIFETFSAVRP